jgi:hypothetical protein
VLDLDKETLDTFTYNVLRLQTLVDFIRANMHHIHTIIPGEEGELRKAALTHGINICSSDLHYVKKLVTEVNKNFPRVLKVESLFKELLEMSDIEPNGVW